MKNLYINGCSFTAGDNLKDEETWPYKLAKLSNTCLYNNSANGQSMGSIFLNTITHLNKLEAGDTTAVIGLTWPHRHYFTYRGANINVTNADFPNLMLPSKLNNWRRLTSSNYIDNKSEEFLLFSKELRETDRDEKIMPIYLAKREYIKAMITHNRDYVKDLTSLFLTQIISLQSFLEHRKFNYRLVVFDSNSSHLKYIKNLPGIDKNKILIFDHTENSTAHPTKEDCTLISKKIYETIF